MPESETAAPMRHFNEGDQLSYVSVTQGHLVVWTRDAVGGWTANDEDWTHRGRATDDDARHALSSPDATYTPAGSDG